MYPTGTNRATNSLSHIHGSLLYELFSNPKVKVTNAAAKAPAIRQPPTYISERTYPNCSAGVKFRKADIAKTILIPMQGDSIPRQSSKNISNGDSTVDALNSHETVEIITKNPKGTMKPIGAKRAEYANPRTILNRRFGEGFDNSERPLGDWYGFTLSVISLQP